MEAQAVDLSQRHLREAFEVCISQVEGDKYYENQFVKIWVGECYHRCRFLDNLLVFCLDCAGWNDEFDHKYDAYGDGPGRLDTVTNRRRMGAYCMEFVYGNFCVAHSYNLQPVNQGLKN